MSILALLHNKISAIGDWILFQCRVWDDIDAQEAIRLELEQRSQDRRLKTCIKSAAIFFFNSNLHYMKAKILEYLKECCDKYIEAPLP